MKDIILTLSILVVSSLSANWQVEENEVQVISTTEKTASITNSLGDTFSVYRARDGKVWGSFNVFNSELSKPKWKKAPFLVVDNNPINLDATKSMQSMYGFHTYGWTQAQVNFYISPNDTEHLISDTLFKLMRGNHLEVHYSLWSGEKVSSTFSLKEANIAIAETLDIDPNIDKYMQKMKKDFNIAIISATTQCRLHIEATDSCLDIARKCSESAYPDVKQYKVCLDESK